MVHPLPSLPARIQKHIGPLFMESESISRSDAKVFRAGDMYLKIAPQGSLMRACQAQEYFHQKRLTSPVVEFVQENDQDWLLVKAVGGFSAVDDALLSNPKRLACALGETFRMLHEQTFSDCPLDSANRRMITACEKERGSAFSGDISFLKEDALLHGDACLPNVFFSENFRFSGFIDLGDAGPGDRHFDLYWTMWSLNYNLNASKYNDVFLNAYGTDAFDAARYNVCAVLSQSV